jgi:hypothetical protein
MDEAETSDSGGVQTYVVAPNLVVRKSTGEASRA